MSEPFLSEAKSLHGKSLYRTVVIDPPWEVSSGFKNETYYRIGRKMPYQTMSDSEILRFPINNFADTNCDLFMWVIHAKLPISLKCFEQWGFKYHAVLTWDKLGGVCISGFYRRTEHVVYGYRGKLGIDLSEGHYIPTLFKESVKEHSRKPDVFYELLRKRTQEPRIDIFARRRHFGFDAFGDQVEKEIEVPLEAKL
jgi:N6-adenosine-specific RNA methylase IME4